MNVGRVLKIAALAVGGLLLIVVAAVVVLRITNPRPLTTSSWTQVADMPGQRGETASAAVRDRLVVAGGLYGVGRTSDSVYVYDDARNEWTRGRSLPAARHHAAAAGTREHVYVSGGAATATNWTPTRTLWRATPGGPWRSVQRMPEGRQGHAMVVLADRIYVVGGVGPSDRTLIYEPARNRWTSGAALPAGRDHLRAVAWKGEIWAVGGRDDAPTTRVDVYDPRTDRWRRGPSLPRAMSAMAVGALADGLHVVGGEDPGLFGGKVIDEHYLLTPGEQRWRSADKSLLPVHGAGYAVLSGRLVVAGGAARQGVLSTVAWTAVTQRYRPPGINLKQIES